MNTDDLARLARGTLLPSFPGPTAPRWVLDALEAGLGGVTLFALTGNVPSPESLAALTMQMRKAGDPFVTIDEEGGDVTRLGGHATGSPYPGNAALGAVDDPELTRRVYRSLGAELAEVGVNLNFAPSVDVNTADDNPVIGTRSFGPDPELVARHAAAAVTGTQEAGVAACAKHFPGHGATVEDSHLSVPLVDADLELLDRRELVPFRAAIEAGTRAVMTGHLNLPAITRGVPATLSGAAITGLLRERLGYQGVIVTDALDMEGASGEIGIPEASVRALIAGADLLCLGPNEHAETLTATLEAIVAAVRAGRLTEERLAASAGRTGRLKQWLAGHSPAVVDRAAGLEAARRAIRVSGSLPGWSAAPLVVELEATGNIAVGPTPWGLNPWAPDAVQADGAEGEADRVLERATGRGLVVVLRDAHRHAGQRALTTALLTARPDTVVVEMGLPVWRPGSAVYLATYGAAAANAQAAAELLGLTTAA
ncbi:MULTISPECIES: glycoside hydrolase family 3 protein [Actinomadura]|uniref:Glycoside hydrolase family 3 protein n=1 Tax=Actinomadura litoris TaxID=2678616 RepID=A0A7K1L6Q7_9ACTN|nr:MULTISPECIES: glycoside hydrolase family 3 N-terminal domain-containing protein [Actinomadura]MBT2209398.1 glycoside hydrolase family 3 protein [Actinomadura sp. NEAU-AAG7]MUN40090.1 glycoside hydrolase family 3 protein [Actinomadura litoris]